MSADNNEFENDCKLEDRFQKKWPNFSRNRINAKSQIQKTAYNEGEGRLF